MKERVVIAGVATALLFVAAALLHGCASVPTRATVERDEDTFCRAVARARVLEAEYGMSADSGAAGAKP